MSYIHVTRHTFTICTSICFSTAGFRRWREVSRTRFTNRAFARSSRSQKIAMVTNCDLDPYLGMGHALRATTSCRLLTMDPNRMKSTPSSRSWEKVQISFQWLDSLFKLLITDADVMDMGNDPQVLRYCKPVPPCSGWPTPHTSSHSVLLDRSIR